MSTLFLPYFSRLFSLVSIGNLEEMGDFTWRESDCEELVGLLEEDSEVGFSPKIQYKSAQIVCSHTTRPH